MNVEDIKVLSDYKLKLEDEGKLPAGELFLNFTDYGGDFGCKVITPAPTNETLFCSQFKDHILEFLYNWIDKGEIGINKAA